MRDTVFDYLGDRILSFYYEAQELKRGSMCRPRFALLYPTYVCNHNCIGCDYTELNSAADGKMFTEVQFDYIIDQIAGIGVRAVEFCGGGEPLLHPNFNQAVRKLHDRGISLGILTNGTVIPDERAQLLTRYCSYIRVSVESGSERVFNRVKRPRSKAAGFERVLANIRRLLFHRHAQKSRCQISYKYTIDKNNADDIEKAIQLAKEIEVDSIQFKAIRNVPSELTIDEKREINDEIQRLRGAYPSVRILGNLLPSQVQVPCWLSPLHLMIDPNGDVFLCCYYRHRMDTHRFGNVFERNLHDIWYSFEHYEKMRNIKKQECELYDCRFIRYAQVMASALDKGQLDFI